MHFFPKTWLVQQIIMIRRKQDKLSLNSHCRHLLTMSARDNGIVLSVQHQRTASILPCHRKVIKIIEQQP